MNTTNYWNKSLTSAAKACLLTAAAVLALLPSSVNAGCAFGWDVSGRWNIKQGPTTVTTNLRQNGNVVTGTAGYIIPGRYKSTALGLWGNSTNPRRVSGTVSGTITGDNFHVEVAWSNNTVGVYDGTFGPSGRIEGTVYGKEAPSKKVTWFSDRNMTCRPPKF